MMKKLFVVALIGAGLAMAALAFGVLSGRRERGPEVPAPAETAGVAAAEQGSERTPVLVELFTSEGCSSCPPADALLSRLDETQPVEGALIVPVALHVDYWNYLGWPDPFSSPEFSTRQGEYSAAFGRDGVYTPQMVVDGVKEFPGSNTSAAHNAIKQAARAPKAAVSITRAVGEDGGVRLGVSIEKLARAAGDGPAQVLLAVTESGLASDVRRGENAGRKLGHVGVVRRLTAVGSLPEGGGAFETETRVVPDKAWRRENLRAVVFAQEGKSRRVLAVGSVKLFE
jgi:hypothetical protein